MDGQRLFKIVVNELMTDNLKLEDELERVINSAIPIEQKTIEIKLLLSKIVATEASLIKFTSMMNNNNNNNEVKTKKK